MFPCGEGVGRSVCGLCIRLCEESVFPSEEGVGMSVCGLCINL